MKKDCLFVFVLFFCLLVGWQQSGVLLGGERITSISASFPTNKGSEPDFQTSWSSETFLPIVCANGKSNVVSQIIENWVKCDPSSWWKTPKHISKTCVTFWNSKNLVHNLKKQLKIKLNLCVFKSTPLNVFNCHGCHLMWKTLIPGHSGCLI